MRFHVMASCSLALLLVTSPVRAQTADASISGNVGSDRIVLTASGSRFAGAISSLTFRGVQYVNIADHGREFQSAIQLDNLGECYNPNEAGSKADGSGFKSSSVLKSLSSNNGILASSTTPAFWLRPGENYGKPCSPFTSISTAQNTTVLSNYTIARTSQFYGPSIPNLIKVDVSFTVPESRTSASIEPFTGYLPPSFNLFLTWDRTNRVLTRVTANTTRQQTQNAVIVAQPSGLHSQGVISPGINGTNPSQAYYAYFFFPGSTATAKWSCVYGVSNITAGSGLKFSCPIALGTVDEVIAALTAYPTGGPAPTSMVPIYRFLGSGKHFMTLTYFEAASAGWNFETTGFHLFPSGGPGYSAIYRCYNAAAVDHFLSRDRNCEGYSIEGVIGYASAGPARGLVTIYRFYKPGTKDHLITVNPSEGSNNGYTNEGILGYGTY